MPSRVVRHNSATASVAGYVYIGRPSRWGNPFVIGRNGTREEVLALYREWIHTQPEMMALARRELRGKTLGCWCAPKACHGDVLAEIANG